MNNRIEELKKEIVNELEKVTSLKEWSELKTNYFNKKGPINELSNNLRDLSIEDKKEFGMLLNKFKEEVNFKLEEIKKDLEEKELIEKLNNEKIDITLPSTKLNVGSIHPLERIIEEIEEIFISMGYDVVEGPEVELDKYVFERLNLPKSHPARDAQDTFYIEEEEILLRVQTSGVQARVMEANKEKTPIRIICPGKVYRRDDDDATHSHQFMQLEALIVDKDISVANLKGTLDILIKKLFGEDRIVRLRPSYFPFTEPSFEVDVSCSKCNGKGCSICKETGWIEVLGSGQVHPNVLRDSGYDPEVYTGFAMGMGIERIAMLKYGITDIRNFYTNDIRFLKNFNRIDGGE